MPAHAVPRVEYAVAKDSLTSFADISFIARLGPRPSPLPFNPPRAGQSAYLGSYVAKYNSGIAALQCRRCAEHQVLPNGI